MTNQDTLLEIHDALLLALDACEHSMHLRPVTEARSYVRDALVEVTRLLGESCSEIAALQ